MGVFKSLCEFVFMAKSDFNSPVSVAFRSPVPTSAAAHFLPPSVAFELASTLLGISPITSAWPSVIRSMSYVEVNAAIVPKRPDMFKETFEMHYEIPRW